MKSAEKESVFAPQERVGPNDALAEENGKGNGLLAEKSKKEKIKAFFAQITRGLKSALYPPDVACDCCGAELMADTRYRLCAACAHVLPRTEGHICLVCGVPSKDESDYCLRCQNTESSFEVNRSPLVYEGIAKDMILSLKFGGKKYIAETLGAMMSDAYISHGMKADVAVYVPMSGDELKARGFNQAALLAEEVGKRLEIPVLPALVKMRSTSSQKTLTAVQRSENLKGAFECVFRQIEGLNVLLIDDVFTTGATANECAKALLKARAKKVLVLTAAVTKREIRSELPEGPDFEKSRGKKGKK